LCPYSQVKHREDTQDVAEDDQMKIDADERSGGYAMLLMVGIGVVMRAAAANVEGRLIRGAIRQDVGMRVDFHHRR
jgi:hypothetical protein